jgi:hypothetical protein
VPKPCRAPTGASNGRCWSRFSRTTSADWTNF